MIHCDRSRVLTLGLALFVVAACNFKGGGNNAGDGDADASPDAMSDGEAGTDANPVCDPITLDLQLNGEALSDPNSLPRLAVGDSINLNAGGSCSPTGNLTFEWVFDSADFINRGTVTNQFFIELYSDNPGERTVTVSINDGTSKVSQDLVFTSRGFAPLDIGGGSATEVRELVVANGALWIAADSGALTQVVNALATVPFPAVNDDFDTPTAPIPADISDVAYDTDNDVVTFLAADGANAYFADFGNDITTRVSGDTADQGSFLDVAHLGGGGVRLLTTLETETTTDYIDFTKEWTRDLAVAIATQGNDVLALGARLYLMVNMEMSDERELFGDEDDDGLATAFIDAGGALWIGSAAGNADTGIAVIDDFADETIDEHLIGETIRSIDQDAAGDMWVATDTGVHRFKSDWGVWIQLGTKHGLADLDALTLVVDDGGGRDQLLVGTASDLYQLRRP